MPVRVKHRALGLRDAKQEERYLESLKEHVVGVLLAWGAPVSVRIRMASGIKVLHVRTLETPSNEITGDSEGLPAFNIQTVRSVLSQARHIEPSDWNTWIHTSARSSFISVEGAISRQAAPSKRTQFIALGIHYINHSSSHNVLYNEVNRLFAASNFGVNDEVSDAEHTFVEKPDGRRKQDAFTQKQLKGPGKGIDQWPMFALRITVNNKARKQSGGRQSVYYEQSIVAAITKVLRAMIVKFLEENHFKAYRKQKVSKPRANKSNTSNQPLLSTAPSSLGRQNRPMPLSEITPKTPTDDRHGSLTERERRGISSSLHRGLMVHTQIPSFRGLENQNRAAAFSSWSRIKSGKRKDLEELFESHSTLPRLCIESMVQNQSPDGHTFDKPNKSCFSADKPSNHFSSTSSPSNALFAGSHGVINLSSQDTTSDEAPTSLVPDLPAAAPSDLTVSWVNPLSRAKVLVNARTGHIVSQPLTSTKAGTRPPPVGSNPPLILASTCQEQRLIPSVTNRPTATKSWARGFLEGWKNPTFSPTEEKIPQISFDGFNLDTSATPHGRHHRCSHIDVAKAFSDSSSSTCTKLSKDHLVAARVIAQVDKKFILVSIDGEMLIENLEHNQADRGEILALIDQHAADERVRVEQLLTDLCTPLHPGHEFHNAELDYGGLSSEIMTTVLVKPITFETSGHEQQLFANRASRFAAWGILYELNLIQQSPGSAASPRCKVTVRTLPDAIAERCKMDPKVLVELLRGEVWKPQDLRRINPSREQGNKVGTWLSRISGCPQGIIDMVISRSCRSAIMFNDELSIGQCEGLVRKLAQCALPFQCAHGRPSMVPLVDMTAKAASRISEHTAFGARRLFILDTDGEVAFSKAWKERNANENRIKEYNGSTVSL